MTDPRVNAVPAPLVPAGAAPGCEPQSALRLQPERVAALPARVVIMAKAPRLGEVKTRLEPLLGPPGCLALHRALLQHVCVLAASSGMTTYVAFDPPDAHDEMLPLVPAAARLLPQRGADLGERMDHAVRDVSALAPGPVIVLGVDAPTLDAELLGAAAAALTTTSAAGAADVVLGPAVDGGYYLIGLRCPKPEAFAIEPALWGGPGVLAATWDRLAAAGLRTRELAMVRDLDTPADAAALLRDPALPAPIGELLRRAMVHQ